MTDPHNHAHGHGHDHHDRGGGDDHDHAGRSHGPVGHHEPPAGFDAAFALGSALNAGFVMAEVVFGLTAHSVALLADAAHNLGDGAGPAARMVGHMAAAGVIRRPAAPTDMAAALFWPL